MRSRTWNANAAVGLARSTLRAELARTSGETLGRWQAVVGWDRTFLADLYVNLQASIEREDEGGATRSGTFAVTKPLLDDAATLAVRGQWAEGGECFTEAPVEYHLRDEVTLSLRALMISASDADTLDFADRDFVELAVRWLY